MALVLNTAEVADKARAMWPDLAEVADARFEAWQAFAERVAGTIFGDVRLEAVANLCAHAVIRSTPGSGTGAAGPVTSLRTLSLSASFGAPSTAALGSDDDLKTTKPGAAYLTLRGSIAGINLPRVIRGCRGASFGGGW